MPPKQPRTPGAIISKAWKRRRWIIRALYLTGLVAFFVMPLTAAKGGLDEKALLVGLTYPSVTEDTAVQVISFATKLVSKTKTEDNKQVLGLAHVLDDANRQLSTDKSFFTAASSIDWRRSVSSSSCQSAYTQVLASRSDGTETLVLSFPIDLSSPATSFTAAFSISLAYHAAALLSRAAWLAKDVTLVLLDTSKCSALQGMEHWLAEMDNVFQHQEQHHYDGMVSPKTDDIDHSSLPGSMQQGLIIDVRSVLATEARLGVLGYGAQLPNLDMLVLVKRNLDYFTRGLSVGLDTGGAAERSQQQRSPFQEYINRLVAATFAAVNIASGRPTGPHAALLRRGTDAVTLQLRDGAQLQEHLTIDKLAANRGAASLTATNALSAVEMVIRTCNNLDERLHHATAMYLPAGADQFVGIGAFMVPPALLLLAAVLQAIDAMHDATAAFTSDDDDANFAAEFRTEEWAKGWRRSAAVHAFGCAALAAWQYHAFHVESTNFTCFLSSLGRDRGECFGDLGPLLIAFALPLCLSKASIAWMDIIMLPLSVFEKKERNDGKHTTAGGSGESRSDVTSATFKATFMMLLVVETSLLLLWRWALCYAVLTLVLLIPIVSR